VLKAAGLHGQFLSLSLPGEDATRWVDRHGNGLLDKPGSNIADRPRSTAVPCVRLLMESLPADAIRWSCKLAQTTASREDGTSWPSATARHHDRPAHRRGRGLFEGSPASV
jgi:hypothetical protein